MWDFWANTEIDIWEGKIWYRYISWYLLWSVEIDINIYYVDPSVIKHVWKRFIMKTRWSLGWKWQSTYGRHRSEGDDACCNPHSALCWWHCWCDTMRLQWKMFDWRINQWAPICEILMVTGWAYVGRVLISTCVLFLSAQLRLMTL